MNEWNVMQDANVKRVEMAIKEKSMQRGHVHFWPVTHAWAMLLTGRTTDMQSSGRWGHPRSHLCL